MTDYLNLFSLSGKNAFVTGGCGLIGLEISKALAQAGAKVIVLDIDKTKIDFLKKEGIIFKYFDITDLPRLDMKITGLKKKYGEINVWVNSAYPRTKDWGDKVEDLKLKSWQENVDMHLNAYSWISRKVCMIMKEQRGGTLINIGSIYGVVGNDFTVYKGTNLTSPMEYAVIKGGIVNLTRYLASYFGKYNVRINSLCPGGIINKQIKVFIKNYSNKTPLKRMGDPEEIASVALFLASEASSYITGATIMVDGGWTAI